MTKSLSPAAQAVLDAFLKTPGEEPMPGWDYGRDLAAALRAAADQMFPINYVVIDNCQYEAPSPEREQILAIAAELDNTSLPS